MAKKIRLHEIAKDYQVSAKYICRILDMNAIPYKNSMQILDDSSVEVIRTYIAQHEEEYAARRKEYVPQKYLAVVKWSDDDYYIVQLIAGQALTRAFLVELCSDSEKYYTDHDSAWDEATLMSRKKFGNREVKEISIDDYPIPEDTETLYDFTRRLCEVRLKTPHNTNGRNFQIELEKYANLINMDFKGRCCLEQFDVVTTPVLLFMTAEDCCLSEKLLFSELHQL